ncbi:hypothetical protein B0T25DRAFT_561486 [Lasiosphaeria hispida]|uniref:Peptidase A1 domain-containing protein n=1 Tax=Lasiosphaeria hispida TaxID=260671 RepID=A0AAJ0MJ47_9PEZI|nr:hypothetical protein B0T25DRAFT_561486 [Lasiosphaeria hispida]
MVQITPVVLAAATLLGQALAIANCTQNQFYCGFTLLDSGANIALWKPKIDAALTERGLPADSDHEFNSLFFCTGPQSVALDEFCPANANFRCQPHTANGCGSGISPNDCCAPSL